MGGRIHRRVQAALLALAQQVEQEILLQERLAAGEGDAAARVSIIWDVALDLGHHLLNGHAPGLEHEGAGKAGIGAGAARPAPVAQIQALPIYHELGVLGADLDARLAGDALIGEELHLAVQRLGFGVVAPEAVQVAPLQEDGCPDARAIVN